MSLKVGHPEAVEEKPELGLSDTHPEPATRDSCDSYNQFSLVTTSKK